MRGKRQSRFSLRASCKYSDSPRHTIALIKSKTIASFTFSLRIERVNDDNSDVTDTTRPTTTRRCDAHLLTTHRLTASGGGCAFGVASTVVLVRRRMRVRRSSVAIATARRPLGVAAHAEGDVTSTARVPTAR